MRQAVWALVVVMALLAGFVGGRVLVGEQQAINDLQKRVAALEKQLGGSAPSAGSSKLERIAVVQFNKLSLRYQESNPALMQQLSGELTQLQGELTRLEDQVKQGTISREEATKRAASLQQETQRKILVAVAGPIQMVINQIAKEKGYDLVLKQEDVILYYKGAALEDITEQVWARLEASR